MNWDFIVKAKHNRIVKNTQDGRVKIKLTQEIGTVRPKDFPKWSSIVANR